MPEHRIYTALGSIAVAAGFLVLVATPAFAHVGEENVPAKTLVEQAIAIIRTQPNQMDAIADKLKDALASKDPSGVNIGLVTKAQQAFESGDLTTTEQDLELAVGALPDQPVDFPNNAPRQPAVASSGTPSPDHLREIAGTPEAGGARVALFLIAGVSTVAGLGVVRRFR